MHETLEPQHGVKSKLELLRYENCWCMPATAHSACECPEEALALSEVSTAFSHGRQAPPCQVGCQHLAKPSAPPMSVILQGGSFHPGGWFPIGRAWAVDPGYSWSLSSTQPHSGARVPAHPTSLPPTPLLPHTGPWGPASTASTLASGIAGAS